MEEIKDIKKIIERYFKRITVLEIVNLINYPMHLKLILISFFVILIGFSILNTNQLQIINPDSIHVNDNKNKLEKEMKISLPDLGVIIRTVNSRQLFKAPPRPVIINTPVDNKNNGPKISEQLQQLVFVGIMDGDPVQAIIESKLTNETYYVKVGDTLLDMEVVSIVEGQVTFRNKDETGVLR